MDQNTIGNMIKKLREDKNMTQSVLAEKLNVSGKTVSKWETGKGYPDIAIVESLADALGISVIELFSGNDIINTNRSFNMLKTKWYVCPICGNIIHSTGEAVVSCHGFSLPPLTAEQADEAHPIEIQIDDGEYYIKIDHEMKKEHYISFIAAVSYNGVKIVKLYPEGSSEARFSISGVKKIMYYCNRDGLFTAKAPAVKRTPGPGRISFENSFS